MRAALDHLFYALILLRHPKGVEDSTVHFPILKDRGTFFGRKKKLEDWIGPEAAAMIENVQPYQGAGPSKNALFFIHTSDVADKHRLLLPLRAGEGEGIIGISVEFRCSRQASEPHRYYSSLNIHLTPRPIINPIAPPNTETSTTAMTRSQLT